jgi:hypothetical protein
MQPVSIIALFCEDIRTEAQGTDSLVGIMPDNLNVPQFPFILPKLSIYLRVLFDRRMDLKPIGVGMRIPGVQGDVQMTVLDDNLISSAREKSESNESPVLGLIARAVLSPFPVPSPGRILVVAKVQGKERICGGLNVQKIPQAEPTTSSATSKRPPSSRSRRAAS